MDLSKALSSLPHGPGFRFIDELISLEPGRRAAGRYTLTGAEPFLPGHFPGQPMMPGVLLIEALAQLGGIIAQTDPDIPPVSRLLLTGVRAAKIKGTAGPGETLSLTAELSGRLGPLIQVDGEVHVAGRLVLSAQITLSGPPG